MEQSLGCTGRLTPEPRRGYTPICVRPCALPCALCRTVPYKETMTPRQCRIAHSSYLTASIFSSPVRSQDYLLTHAHTPFPPLPPPQLQVRSTLQRILRHYNNALSTSPSGDLNPLSDLAFITGTSGGGKLDRNENDINSRDDKERGSPTVLSGGEDVKGGAGRDGGWREQRYSSRNFSLGKLLTEALRTDYDPPLRAQSAAGMVGCLLLSAADLEVWAKAQGAGGERAGS